MVEVVPESMENYPARDHEETITTDASGSRGCAGFWQSHWFQQPWESQEALTNQCIATKEMLPILVARGALPGPLFQLQDRTPLTKDYFIHKFRAVLTNIGLEASQYAGHSFRIGAATTAAEKAQNIH